MIMINMKNNILLTGLSIILALTGLSCSDNTDDNLPDNKVYIVNGGEQGTNVTLYDTGEKDIYNLHLYRSGKYGNAANVKVKILSQAEVDEYNLAHGTDYVVLPASVYSLLNTEVTYSSKDEDVDKSIQIEFDPATVRTILEGNLANNYAIPVQIDNASVDVNTENNIAFVRPSVKDPLVYMGLTGFASYFYKPGDEVQSISMDFPVNVDFKNLWDITCDITANQDVLDEYNNDEGTFYTLLPAASYTLDNQVVIMNGKKKAVAKLNVDGTKLTYGNYCLPVVLNSVSKFEVDATRDTYLIGIFIEAPMLDRTGWAGVDWNTYASAGEGANGSVDKLLDGDFLTYWHSQWTGGTTQNPNSPPFPHWFVIDMKKEYNVTQVDLARRNNNNSSTKDGEFYITSDDVPALVAANKRDQIQWTKIGTFHMENKNEYQQFGTLKTKGRYLKVNITTSYNAGNVSSLSEVAVHGYE
ncbi:galactose oxidase [Bacteroidia bacterium]|nr:galactose oxidase [Bacteroidia bacterium]